MMLPETFYTRSGSVNIAYQVFGNGSHDLVLVPGWVSNVDVFWEEPTVVRFFEGLAKFSRVLLFDKRGTGLSDRVTGIPTLEDRMDDVRAVMNAADSKDVTLFGYSEGGPMCALFAATYPERTRALVLMGSYARRRSAPDYECGLSDENTGQLLEDIESGWGSPLDIERRIPSLASNPRFKRWWAKFMRAGASPASAAALMKMNFQIDVRPILPSIRVPALILHAKRDRIVDVESGRYLAQHIPNAGLIEFDADDHVPFGDSMSQVLVETQKFVTGRSDVYSDDRVLSTIMFTDIVNSTRVATEMGDSAWRDSLAAHHATVRGELAIHRGTEIKTTGDGFHATFDGPARAITLKANCGISSGGHF